MIAREKINRYLFGECYRLAMAVSRLTGWPMVVIDLDLDVEDRADGPHGLPHVVVRMPDGRLLDAEGPHSDYSGVKGCVYEAFRIDRWFPLDCEDCDDDPEWCALHLHPDAETEADARELLRAAGWEAR